MKKILAILLSFVSVICILFAVGCIQSPSIVKSIGEGIYEDDSGPSYYVSENDTRIAHDKIKKVKLVLKRIDKATFNEANGLNVVEDVTQKNEDKKYFSFELFFLFAESDNYVQINVTETKYNKGSPFYWCKAYYWSEYFSIDTTMDFSVTFRGSGKWCSVGWTEKVDGEYQYFDTCLELKN